MFAFRVNGRDYPGFSKWITYGTRTPNLYVKIRKVNSHFLPCFYSIRAINTGEELAYGQYLPARFPVIYGSQLLSSNTSASIKETIQSTSPKHLNPVKGFASDAGPSISKDKTRIPQNTPQSTPSKCSNNYITNFNNS